MRKFICLVALFFSLLTVGAVGQNFRYNLDSRDVIKTRLERFTGKNKQREETLKQMFKEAGCDDQQLIEPSVKGSKLPNVICMLPGSSENAIIVGAHFDHVDAGNGVIDNWSGASLLPSLYEAVKREPRKHTYAFIGFTDEERGLVGSHYYAKQMTKDQVAMTDAMINMDTLGLGPTEVWADHSDKKLAGVLAYIAKKLTLPLTGMNVGQNSTDSESFAERKIPRITIHSLTQEAWDARILHSSKDRLSAVRFDDYYQTYKLLAAYISFLDQVLPQKSTDK
jgi:Zn-dependent M28 family amino/carboxypeptidase